MTLIIIFLIALMIFCRFRLNVARKQLTNEQKGQFLDLLTSIRIHMIVGAIIIVGSSMVIVYFGFPLSKVYIGLMVFIVLVMLGQQVYIYKRLKKLNFPQAYLNDYVIYIAILYISFLAAILVLYNSNLTF